MWFGDLDLLLSKVIPFLLDLDLDEADFFYSDEFLESIRLERGLEKGFTNIELPQNYSLNTPKDGVESDSYSYGLLTALAFIAVCDFRL